MAEFTVKNPTSKAKAVLIKGGHMVIKAKGGSETVTADWDENRLEQYKACGLVITKGKAPAAKAAPKAEDAK